MSREPIDSSDAPPDQLPFPVAPTNWGDRLAWVVATGFGIGLAPKAPGTFGSLLGPLLCWSWQQFHNERPFYESCLAATLAFVIGALAADRTATRAGLKDPGHIVIDEIVAFCVVFNWTRVTWRTAILGFVLFRVFDIWKPWPIRRLERLPGGWGIMADDLMAGVYAAVALMLFSNHL